MYVLLDQVIVIFCVPSTAPSDQSHQKSDHPPPPASIASLTAFSVGMLVSVHGVPKAVTMFSISACFTFVVAMVRS